MLSCRLSLFAGRRRSFVRVLALLMTFCSVHSLLLAQGMSTMGTDFWFSFMQGGLSPTFSVTVTGLRDCNGTISNPNTGWSLPFSVPAGGSVVIGLDREQCYNNLSNTVMETGLHLVTTDTVSVYISNFMTASFDATYVFPTNVLQDEYMIQTFQSSRTYYRSEVLLVAVEDSTYVDIFPTAVTVNTTEGSDTQPWWRMLNAGQCLLLRCATNWGDYSGTVIKTRECKPIAVFCGHECAYVPDDDAQYCDHLFEQCMPMAYCGKNYVVTMTMRHRGDYVKVTSLEDSCNITVGPDWVASINRGESYGFSIEGYPYARRVVTSKPSMVNIYVHSKSADDIDGDPSMILVPPLEQQLRDVVFVNYNFQNQLTRFHYVNIVTRTENCGNIRLDGGAFSDNDFNAVPYNPEYSYVRANIGPGAHRLQSIGGGGFTAHAYGIGYNEGYGYAVGFAARRLNLTLSVNGLDVVSGDTVEMCVGTMEAVAHRQEGTDQPQWFLSGSSYSYGDTLRIDFAEADTVEIKAIATVNDACFPTDDTVRCVVIIHPNKKIDFDSVVCDSSFVWHGLICDTAGTYTFDTVTANGCDSLRVMHLNVYSSRQTIQTIAGCDSLVFHDVRYYEGDTILMATLHTVDGCDSLVKGIVSINHSASTIDNVRLYEGDTLLWIDGEEYYNDSVSPTVTLLTSEGCDSTVRLVIKIIPRPFEDHQDSAVLWVPNAFMPDEQSNNVFKIFSNYILEMHVWIFDRGGAVVTDFDGLTDFWDGTREGRKCMQGCYVYLVEYRTVSMPDYIQRTKGTVLLLR